MMRMRTKLLVVALGAGLAGLLAGGPSRVGARRPGWDDAELDRVGDLELYSDKWIGLADGSEIKVGQMSGRSRPYRVEMRYSGPVYAHAIGFNDKCDVAVATVVSDQAQLKAAERMALDFLNTERVLRS